METGKMTIRTVFDKSMNYLPPSDILISITVICKKNPMLCKTAGYSTFLN